MQKYEETHQLVINRECERKEKKSSRKMQQLMELKCKKMAGQK